MNIGKWLVVSLALVGSVACASGADESEKGGEDGLRVSAGKAPAGEDTVDPKNYPPTQCNAAELQQAENHAFVHHSLPGPMAPMVYVTSCTYNASTGYIVYSYAYSYHPS